MLLTLYKICKMIQQIRQNQSSKCTMNENVLPLNSMDELEAGFKKYVANILNLHFFVSSILFHTKLIDVEFHKKFLPTCLKLWLMIFFMNWKFALTRNFFNAFSLGTMSYYIHFGCLAGWVSEILKMEAPRDFGVFTFDSWYVLGLQNLLCIFIFIIIRASSGLLSNFPYKPDFFLL